MYEVCPVCNGRKMLEYEVSHGYGKRWVKTKCWACRGSGYVDYKEESNTNVVTESRIEEMYESVGV